MKEKSGIAGAARAVPCSEGTLRRLERKGVIQPERDPWGRRLFGDEDIQAARRYLEGRGPARAGAAA